ncbi:MAG: GTPase Era [Alphaproteobacteria bacterium]|nr:MAG: GTPase Era [Alphaproteobacteria bacterium]
MSKSGFITIVGYPNSGKSTLMNALVGQKISIVTHKVQTTRRQIQGVLTEGNYQAIFIDTPGIFDPKKPLEKAIVDNAYKSFQGVDLVMLVMDARKYDEAFVEKIKKAAKNTPFCLVLNKIDLMDQKDYETLPGMKISAKTGVGLDILKQYIFEHLPEHPFMYDPEQITNINQKIWSAEITREKAMLLLQQELPYELYVETEKFEETDAKADIHQTIVVSRDSLKGIVLGAKGMMIKKIGMEARKDLSAQMNKKVNLFLFVKVRKDWQEKMLTLKSLGIL